MKNILNDENRLRDILMHLKDLMTSHGMAIKESNCPNMRALCTKLSGQTADEQFALFEYMNKHGMYPVDNAEPDAVKQVLQAHKN